MKKLSKLTLHQLDKAELDKRQEGLLFGGGTPGNCRCGSCSGGGSSTVANREANRGSGYTGSGSNPNAECTCHSDLSSNIACTKPVF